jgi:hypothetical protein
MCAVHRALCTDASFECSAASFSNTTRMSLSTGASESAQQARVDTFPKALELATGVAASVKGHPKYGANSTVYAAMGYTTKGTRSSGLTRRRDAQTPKETA